MTVTINKAYRTYEVELREGRLSFPAEGIPCAR